jgi:hypothetical protein
LQYQVRLRDLRTDDVNGTRLFRPKDLVSSTNRMVLWLESAFPALFYGAKREAIKQLVRFKSSRAGLKAGPHTAAPAARQ